MNTHIPVLLQEAIANLNIQPDGLYIDGTFGRGGHSQAILQRLGLNGHLIVIDKDDQAIAYARTILGHDPRILIVKDSFCNMAQILATHFPSQKADGILLDLGVSSPQLDDPERGFSFRAEAPLDMRMDQTQDLSAADLVNNCSETELITIIKKYGEERFATRIARQIIAYRQTKKIELSSELAQIITKAYPNIKTDKHPATRTFQALRIAVNNELGDLEQFLSSVLTILNKHGRLVTICFHSLEYRLMKYFILQHEKDLRYPAHVPVPHHLLQPDLKRIALKIKPSTEEVAANVRSRSALMQVVEKL